ncbi:uncharacterized protein F4807DRAFT_472482 [Annulohypoxylon truncatum]|uniref:uncharacterized protein n=1 Tax=Annulohypoxylon truncatum TaxID=327061 RepID=UPI0020085D21|nr:uncharacterized protein F4807DRAFT_472482 [Annulohypoxylon truncatum]KAI1204158.1 hypothetical protein F4807DRAFT_472482 [Annulohypoxylon truncatum]
MFRINHIWRIIFLGTPHFGQPHSDNDKDPIRGLNLSAEAFTLLHRSASQFFEILKQIDTEIQVLSGFQTSPKKKLLWLKPEKRHSIKMIVDQSRARIGFKNEIVSPIDMDLPKVLDGVTPSTFRNLINENIVKAIEDYQKWVVTARTSTLAFPGEGNSSVAIRTPSTSTSSGLISSTNANSDERQPQIIRTPLIYPNNFLNQQPSHFQSRPELRSQIEDSLIPSDTQSCTGSSLRTFIITGLGGMGKTELARDFAITHQHKFELILFLVVDHKERISQQYTNIATRLGLVKRDTTDAEDAREKLKAWLRNPVRYLGSQNPGSESATDGAVPIGEGENTKVSWLLIFDNADTPLVLKDFWPTMGLGSVLVTSRDATTATHHFPTCNSLVLKPLGAQQAIALLKVISRSNSDTTENNNAALAITRRLDGLPLAIYQIGSIIARLHLSLTEFVRDYVHAFQYYQLYDERPRFVESPDECGYEHSIGSVWAFEELERNDKPGLQLLNVMSMLDPTCIHEEVMFHSLNDETKPSYPHTKDEYHHAVARLIERSLIQKDSGDGSASLCLHRLVQDVARARMANNITELMSSFNIAWGAVAKVFPYRDEEMNTAGSIKRWKGCASMYPHVVRLSQVAQEIRGTHPDQTFPLDFLNLLYEASWWQCERGDAAEAKPLADLGRDICDSLSPPDPSNTRPGMRDSLQSCQTKFWACQIIMALNIGDSNTAFHYSLLRYQWAEREHKFHGKINGFLTSTYNTLGQSYALIRSFDKAVEYLEKSAELRRKMPDFREDWLFSPFYHLGVTYSCMGRFDDAAKYLQKAIADREAHLGPSDRESSRTGSLHYALGNVYSAQGFGDQAYAEHHRAYMQCRQTAGETALATLRCSQKLAEHYERYGYDGSSR